MNIAIGNSIKELENPVVNLSFSKYFPEKIKNDCIIITFALTVHATLPIRTASRGVSFTFRSFFKIQRLHFFISLFANWLFYIRMQYNKPAFTIPQQIDQLKNRGLIIPDEILATKVLQNISYYRLAGYWWPMQSDKVTHQFKPYSTFNNVLELPS